MYVDTSYPLGPSLARVNQIITRCVTNVIDGGHPNILVEEDLEKEIGPVKVGADGFEIPFSKHHNK